MTDIAKHLTERGIPTPTGKSKWSVSTVRSTLTNEKYKGDTLLQKTYTVDFITKEVRKNNGEVRQYLIEHSHCKHITKMVLYQISCRATLAVCVLTLPNDVVIPLRFHFNPLPGPPL